MSTTQLIVVCTEDNVLAKRVRFLLARDDVEVEICHPTKLEERLEDGRISMLILSRRVDGRDSLGLLEAHAQDRVVPMSIVLGGEPVTTPGYITIISDASVGSSRVDLQACKLEYSIVSPK